MFWSDKEEHEVIYLREDYQFDILRLPIEENCVIKYKDNRRFQGWWLLHQLLLPCQGLGIKSMALLTCGRSIVLDALSVLGKEFSTENINITMVEWAKEQEHKAYSLPTNTTMSKATMWLSVASAILILSVCLVWGLKQYGG